MSFAYVPKKKSMHVIAGSTIGIVEETRSNKEISATGSQLFNSVKEAANISV